MFPEPVARSMSLLVVASLMIRGPAASADTYEVAVGSSPNAFTPEAVGAVVGDSVHWSAGSSPVPHNVREDGGIFRSGDPTVGPIDFTVTVSAGAFHYYCEVHGGPSGGMAGTISVPPSIDERPSGPRFKVRWATNLTSTGSRFDVQFRVGHRRWRDWRRNTHRFLEVFGLHDDPIEPDRGTRYSFRVRSQRGRAESGWSPVARFRA